MNTTTTIKQAKQMKILAEMSDGTIASGLSALAETLSSFYPSDDPMQVACLLLEEAERRIKKLSPDAGEPGLDAVNALDQVTKA